MDRRSAIKTASTAVLGSIATTQMATGCIQKDAQKHFVNQPENYLKEGEYFRNSSPGVIGVSDKNPHYFQYKGREVLLITSAEHYGGVINKAFDYVRYFDMLAQYGLNYTRIYPGAIVEPEGFWLAEDMLAPAGKDLIVPWMRSNVPGYKGGGNKFDLDKWDPEYFDRLRDFMKEADKRNIIVEIAFFNCQNKPYWAFSPLQKDNNIQRVGDCDHVTFQSLNNAPLVREQFRFVEKLVMETNEFDNVIYEIVDEPTLMLTPTQKAYLWISEHLNLIINTELKLTKKHIIAQQLELGVDFCDDDRLALIVTQYIGMNSRQVGGIPALNSCYCYNKPIELNETAYVPSWYDHDHTAIARLESWEFMIGGGAGFNQLNGYYVPSNPSGENETNRKILTGLLNLRTFLESFDFAKMTRDNDTPQKISIGASVNMISEKGRQYAMYIHHSFPNIGKYVASYYEPNYGVYEPKVTLVGIPDGEYTVTFIEPGTMTVLREETMVSDGGETILACPRYTLDLAVKVVAKA